MTNEPKPSPEMPELLIWFACPDAVVGSFRNVSMWSWRSDVTPLIVGEVRRCMLGVAKQHPDGMGGFTFVHRGARVPDDGLRKQITKMRRESAYAMKGGAVLYEGDGMRGALVRGVVTGLMLLAPEIYPHSVVATIPEGVGFLRKKLGEKCPDATELGRAVSTLKSVVA